MLSKSSVHHLIYSSVIFLILNSTKGFSKRIKRDAASFQPKCFNQSTPVDQIITNYSRPTESRKKRFVLFPEFILFLNDPRYIHRPSTIRYWIANFYPTRINSDYLHIYIKHIVGQINTVLSNPIIIQEAVDPGEANFHFTLFDYTICPMDDPSNAVVDNVTLFDPLLIYSVDLTRDSRYRAHGGIYITVENESISAVKLNMQQTFLYSDDFIYDPVIYTCIDALNQCEIDLYWVLLHETLHGFGIEHTTNHQQPTPPNPHMKSVMHFSNFRILCHDDIRAIRKVYELPVVRKNAVYDDTCRRDFPMNSLQKIMYFIGRIITIIFIGFLILGFILCTLAIIYLLLKKRKSNVFENQPSRITINKPMIKTKRTHRPQGYLWHDEMN